MLILAMRDGGADPETLAGDIRRVAPDADLAGVWCGDPQLRPSPPAGVAWIDLHLHEPVSGAWGRLAVALDPTAYGWCRSIRAAGRVADQRPVVVIDANRVAIASTCPAGALDDLVPDVGVAAIMRSRSRPDGGRAEAEVADVLTDGSFSSGVIAFGRGSGSAADRIADAMAVSPPDISPTSALSTALAIERAVDLPRCLAAGWEPGSEGTSPDIVDLTSVHVEAAGSDTAKSRWSVVVGGRGSTRSLPTAAVEIIDRAVARWRGDPTPLVLPGNVRVDHAMQRLVAASLAGWRRDEEELPPDPFGSDSGAFLAWLETPSPPWGPDIGRYWSQLWSMRPDLQGAFPDPDLADRAGFRRWAARRWSVERQSPILDPVARQLRPPWADVRSEPGGVNLVGHLATDNSIGDVARRLERCLAAAGVPHRSLHYARSGSPPTAEYVSLDAELAFDTNVLVVNGDQIELLAADHDNLFRAGRRNIGYWFWELDRIPDAWIRAAARLDELWVATDYSAAAFRAVLDIPVRVVDVPVPEPVRSDRARESFGMPSGRFTFLVTFDHLSVTERKNPAAAIRAFTDAFPVPLRDGPVLYVKTLNRAHRPIAHDRLHAEVAGRTDIVIVDEHLARADQMALLAQADVLVSLHRAEGLGLHLIEAMWMATPVLTTRYSGNLQFTTDANAALVDADLVPVTNGEDYLPEGAVWAEPDRDQAAAWMQRLYTEPETRARLVDGGRAWVTTQPSFAEAGRHVLEMADRVRSAR